VSGTMCYLCSRPLTFPLYRFTHTYFNAHFVLWTIVDQLESQGRHVQPNPAETLRSGVWTLGVPFFYRAFRQSRLGRRCYMRDPDGYLIEVGQYTEVTLDWFKNHRSARHEGQLLFSPCSGLIAMLREARR
jgi:hypothetical protein